MTPNTKYLIPQILIVDSDQSNWKESREKSKCVGFLSKALLDSVLDMEQQPEDILDRCRHVDDGTLYLLFDGIWGCGIEMWFSGDPEYDTQSRNPEKFDPYWSGSTLILQDGFVYLVDDDDMTVDRIGEGYTYFKARQLKYRVIPD